MPQRLVYVSHGSDSTVVFNVSHPCIPLNFIALRHVLAFVNHLLSHYITWHNFNSTLFERKEDDLLVFTSKCFTCDHIIWVSIQIRLNVVIIHPLFKHIFSKKSKLIHCNHSVNSIKLHHTNLNLLRLTRDDRRQTKKKQFVNVFEIAHDFLFVELRHCPTATS